ETVRVWEVVTGEVALTLRGHANTVRSVAYSPDGGRLASGGSDGQVILWDPRTGDKVCSFPGLALGVCCVAFSPDGQSIAAAGLGSNVPDQAGEVRTWEVATGKQLLSFTQRLSAWSVAFSPDGRQIASAGFDTVTVRGTPAGTEIHSFKDEDNGPILC